MKIRSLFVLFFFSLCIVFLTANKNGRASSQNRGNTGAPGDETNPNGTAKTCMSCHNSGPITASLNIRLLDDTGNLVTKYQPGATYKAVVKIIGTNAPKGYGFQMIALKDAGNVDLKSFSDVNPNNYKLGTISNGRVYAEHDNVSAVDTFAVTWKAPAAGTGTVTFYASGNAVDKNGSTSNDGAAVSTLKITEAVTSAEDEPLAESISIGVAPNPVTTEGNLYFTAARAGNYRLEIFNIAGIKVFEQNAHLAAGQNALYFELNGSPSGLYWGSISREGKALGTAKIVKN